MPRRSSTAPAVICASNSNAVTGASTSHPARAGFLIGDSAAHNTVATNDSFRHDIYLVEKALPKADDFQLLACTSQKCRWCAEP
jgi:hypothetical protein